MLRKPKFGTTVVELPFKKEEPRLAPKLISLVKLSLFWPHALWDITAVSDN